MPALEIAVEFTMRGLAEDGSYVKWHVLEHPDYEGEKAPKPVRPGTVEIEWQMTDGSTWYCLDCESRIEHEREHEEDPAACDLEKVRQVMER